MTDKPFYSELTGKSYRLERHRTVAEKLFGKPQVFTPERKAKISASVKQWIVENPEAHAARTRLGQQTYREAYGGTYPSGWEHTDETKELMRQAKLGVAKSDEHRAHMANSQQRRWAAIRGEQWAVSWYLDNDKTVPSYPRGSGIPGAAAPADLPMWEAAREAAIKAYRKK